MAKKALLVGINYNGTPNQLKGCITDVTKMDIFFKGKGFETILLTDNTIVKPTRKNIEQAVLKLVSNVQSSDVLVFHYSGHGSNAVDANNEESDKKDEVLVPLDYATAGIITDDWLNTNLCDKIPIGASLYAFTDCCHSGTLFDLKYNVISNCVRKSSKGQDYIPSDWTENFSFQLEGIEKDTNGIIVLMSGCRDAETSADAFINNESQGAFTNCLLESFKTPGTILQKTKEINARLKIKGFKQNSQLSIGRLADLEKSLSFC